MRAVARMSSTDNIFFGSDCTFASRIYTGKGDPQPKLSPLFDNKERRNIDRLNALKQFPRLKKIYPAK
jgi:hypothetical protein